MRFHEYALLRDIGFDRDTPTVKFTAIDWNRFRMSLFMRGTPFPRHLLSGTIHYDYSVYTLNLTAEAVAGVEAWSKYMATAGGKE